MSGTTLQRAEEFHRIFKVLIAKDPNIHNEKINALRIKTLREEVDELEEALEQKDEVLVLDALTDLQYFIDGAYLSLGYWRFKEAAHIEVHRSNLTKLDTNGNPIYREDGKVMKGPNFELPRLAEILAEG